MSGDGELSAASQLFDSVRGEFNIFVFFLLTNLISFYHKLFLSVSAQFHETSRLVRISTKRKTRERIKLGQAGGEEKKTIFHLFQTFPNLSISFSKASSADRGDEREFWLHGQRTKTTLQSKDPVRSMRMTMMKASALFSRGGAETFPTESRSLPIS